MAALPQLGFICVLMSLTTTLAATQLRGSTPSFAAFITEHSRAYSKDAQEYHLRHAIFSDRLREVQQHNSNPQRRWNAGINHLSDRTHLELAQLRGLRAVKSGRGAPGMVAPHGGTFLRQVGSLILPENKSWTHLNAVSEAVDQDACGSCWAVATATVLRANAEINGYDRTFSPQELVDCTPNPHHCGGNGGCAGSTVELAMNWVMEKGLDTTAETPYTGMDNKCKKQSAEPLPLLQVANDDGTDSLKNMIAVGFHGPKSKASPGVALGLQGWTRLPENEYEPVINALATTGPVAVSVAAGEWQAYQDGIFDSCTTNAIIDHAVSLVGYGVDKGEKYWTVKNSWGNGWGETGLIRLLRKEGNGHCGTDNQPEVGTGCDEGPASVPVCGMCGILYDTVAVHFNKHM